MTPVSGLLGLASRAGQITLGADLALREITGGRAGASTVPSGIPCPTGGNSSTRGGYGTFGCCSAVGGSSSSRIVGAACFGLCGWALGCSRGIGCCSCGLGWS